MADPLIREEESLLENVQQGDIGGTVQRLGSMLLPQAGLPGQRGLGDILADFVEFSTLGDVMDIGAAADPNSGLDPLERLIAASPFFGVGAVGVRQGYRRMATRHLEHRPTGHSLLPPPGHSFDLSGPSFEDLGGTTPTAPQNRQQAAKFEQASLERQSPFARSILRAADWDELAEAVDPTIRTRDLEAPAEVVAARTDVLKNRRREQTNAIRGLGRAIVNQVNDPTIYGPDPEVAEFTAAKVALAKYNRAIELGIIDKPAVNIPGIGGDATERLTQMIELEVSTSGVLGPDLNMPSPARLGRVWRDSSTGRLRVAYGINDQLLPKRVFDWDRMVPFDDRLTHQRQVALDFEAMEGIGAANLAKAYVQAPPAATDSVGGIQAKDQQAWYRAMNRSARALSEMTPYSVTQTSGIIAALSANTPWLPDNLIGAVHVVLQTGRPDLIPGTSEYIAAFRKATLGAGWGWDMFNEAGELAQAQFGQMPGAPEGIPDFEGLMRHYSDPNVPGAGSMMDATKRDKIDLILKANLPPWLVLRGMKTNTFSSLGADPTQADLVTVDVMNDRAWYGTTWVPRPLAHEAYAGKAIDANETYFDPVSGEEIRGSQVLERVEAMREHGWTDTQVERWKELLGKFPTKRQMARYLAQARSHLLVRDEFRVEFGHEVQAATWAAARSWNRSSLAKRLEGVRDLEEFRRLAESATLDPTFWTHLEGNPALERTAAGLVWNVDDTLAGPLPAPEDLKAVTKGVQRPASGVINSSIIAVATPDGKVTPYANVETEGVTETLRHATPTGLRVGGYERFISNKARGVLSVQDHFADAAQYRREDGRTAAGFASYAYDPEGLGHPGMLAGDRVVMLVDPEALTSVEETLQSDYAFDYRVVDASGSSLAASRNKIHASELQSLTDAQLREVLLNNDWVAITAYRSEFDGLENRRRQNELKRDIRALGGEMIEAEGRYPGEEGVVDEPSLFVTGISYADAIKLGKKYGQEAVASRYGMLNMDGTYHEVLEDVAFGDSVDPDSHTRLATGQKFSFNYDWDESHPLPPDPDTLADTAPGPKPMKQVTIDLGGEYGGANWNVIERVMTSLMEVPGARVRLYTHSPSRIPSGFKKATESVVTDPVGVTGSILHRGGDRYARHHADVWIPEWEYMTLSEDGFSGERTRRAPADARAIMEIDEVAGMIWLDKDLAISVPPDANVTLGKSGPIFRTLRVNGQVPRRLVVDTNGPVPILAVEDSIPAPGRTIVELSRGLATKIIPHHEGDWALARDALSAAGLIPEDGSVDVEMPRDLFDPRPGEATPLPEGVEATAHIVYASTDTATIEKIPQGPEDADLTKRMQELIPIHRINLGRNARPELRTEVESILLGLHGDSSRYAAFRARFGDLPASVWKREGDSRPATIDTAAIDRPGIAAVTTMDDPPTILLNERTMLNRWNHGARRDSAWLYTNPKASDMETILIHEIGHLLTRHFPTEMTWRSEINKAIEAVGTNEAVVGQLVSEYAYTSPREFFAEAFARVVFEPDRAHPALVELISSAIDYARGGSS